MLVVHPIAGLVLASFQPPLWFLSRRGTKSRRRSRTEGFGRGCRFLAVWCCRLVHCLGGWVLAMDAGAQVHAARCGAVEYQQVQSTAIQPNDALGSGLAIPSRHPDFRIWSRTVPAQNFGLFLYTTGASAEPDLAASGICLPASSVRRSGIFASGGTAGACDGVLDIDWNDFGAALAQDDPALAVPGTTVHGQFVWFEPFGSSALTWSDAVALQLCP